MRLHDTATAKSHQVSPRARSIRRAGAIAMAIGVAVIVGLSLSGTATAANQDGPRDCTNRQAWRLRHPRLRHPRTRPRSY